MNPGPTGPKSEVQPLELPTVASKWFQAGQRDEHLRDADTDSQHRMSETKNVATSGSSSDNSEIVDRRSHPHPDPGRVEQFRENRNRFEGCGHLKADVETGSTGFRKLDEPDCHRCIVQTPDNYFSGSKSTHNYKLVTCSIVIKVDFK